MKTAVNSVRILVGTLFILSGLVKANDPLGLGYKMQEFLEIWSSSLQVSSFFLKNVLISIFSFGHQHSLAISMLMITLEIVTGAALLLGWKRERILNLLLILILFFTFLTGYAYGSGRFKNCGCFGDCLPISPLTSFLKDLVLTVMFLFLIRGKRFIQPLFAPSVNRSFLIGSLLAAVGLQVYVLAYLPFVDCLPFKKGASIAQGMKTPPNAITDSFAIRFVYGKGGKRFEFSPQNLPADLATYKFITRADRLVRKGNAEPPIKGFSLIGLSGTDSTEAILNEEKNILLFCEYFEKDNNTWMTDFKELVAAATRKNIPVYVVTTTVNEGVQVLHKNGIGGVPLFSCDNTAVRTAARAVPTIFLLRRGVIQQKYSYHKMDALTGNL